MQVLWGLKLIQFFGPSLQKGIRNYEYKFKCESKYLFIVRKEITTNYKLKKTDRYYKHHKIQKNGIMYLLINYLTHLYNTFFLHFLAACSLITCSYYNDFVTSFSIERMEI